MSETELIDVTSRRPLGNLRNVYYAAEKITATVTVDVLQGEIDLGGAGQVADKPNEDLVPPIRIERTTRGLGNRCSIQLSYGGIKLTILEGVGKV